MVSSKKFLEKCSTLKEAGIQFEFSQGMTIARGFADLGIEEFIMLTESKICSLYSGKTSTLPPEEQERFFHVPDCDMMIDKLAAFGMAIEKLLFLNQRSWQLTIRSDEGGEFSFEAGTLADVLIEALISLGRRDV